MADEFKSELLLARSVYNTTAVRKDMEAVAQILQNIMIFEKGNFPNNPELGFGIENYQFELIDDTTMQEMKSELSNQISLFLPTQYNINYDIEEMKNGNGMSVLVFSFQVTNTVNGEVGQIDILVGKSNQKKLLTKILI